MRYLLTFVIAASLAGCASAPTDGGIRRTQIRDCPVGQVLVCETRRVQDPSRGGDEEIPEYEFCFCENVM